MIVNSQRTKEIDAYLDGKSEIGRWPVEIAGEKHILPFHRFPIKLLRYNVDNGRLVMERRQWEAENNRELDPLSPTDAKIIKDLLLGLDKDKTTTLRADLQKKGQMEPGVITHDGFVINGNRRMAILEALHAEVPTGKFEYLEAVRLPPEISEKDLWKIEAGLQLSKDKIAEYHPVNELLKIRAGINAGLSVEEVAAAMYGRTVDEVKEALSRLQYIDLFLEFMQQKGNYGFIKRFGLHEYFIDLQRHLIAPAERQGVSKRERTKRLNAAFALLRAHALYSKQSDKPQKGITHWDFRKIGKVLDDAHASSTFLEPIGNTPRQLHDTPPVEVIDAFQSAVEVLSDRDQRDQPVKLINKAVKALESIDAQSDHFKEDRVKIALGKLKETVDSLIKMANA